MKDSRLSGVFDLLDALDLPVEQLGLFFSHPAVLLIAVLVGVYLWLVWNPRNPDITGSNSAPVRASPNTADDNPQRDRTPMQP